jgi:glycosidase
MNKRGFYVIILAIMVLSLSLFSCQSSQSSMVKADTVLTTPEWAKNVNIYEVNIRQYTPEGTINAFSQHLPRLKDMGVDILWLMPINPIGEKNRKGTLGSYYSVKDYTTINPEFGTLTDFKAMVIRAHELGMKVIVDWVANHTSWDHAWMTEHPDWYTKDSTGKIVSPFDWTDVADLNYDKPEMRREMLNALKYWVKEADIDGYRCDVAGMVPVDFWNNVRASLDSIKPVFMLAEAEEPALHDKAFDMAYSWSTHHVMNQIAKGKLTARSMDSIILFNKNRFQPYTILMQFTSNHDENSWNGTEYERMGKAAQTFAVLAATIPGMPLIYSGQEAGLNKRLEFFEKDPISWNNYPLGDFYKNLLKLKHNNPAIWNGVWGGSYQKVITSDSTSVFAFTRVKDSNTIFVIANLKDAPVKLSLVKGAPTGQFTELFSGGVKDITANSSFDLKPYEYLVFYK